MNDLTLLTREKWFGPVALGIFSVMGGLNLWFITNLVSSIETSARESKQEIRTLTSSVAILQAQMDFVIRRDMGGYSKRFRDSSYTTN